MSKLTNEQLLLRKQLNDDYDRSTENNKITEVQKYEDLKSKHDAKVKVKNDLLFKDNCVLNQKDRINDIDKQIQNLKEQRNIILDDMKAICPHEHPMFSSLRGDYVYGHDGTYHYSICNVCESQVSIKYNNESFTSYDPRSHKIKRIDKAIV